MLNLVTSAKLYGLLGILCAGLIGGGYVYSKYQAKTIENLLLRVDGLNQQLATVKEVNETNLATIAALEEEFNRYTGIAEELRNRMESAERGTEQLRETLRDNNLKELSNARPGLIERRVNNATQTVFEELESITTN